MPKVKMPDGTMMHEAYTPEGMAKAKEAVKKGGKMMKSKKKGRRK